MLGFLHPSKAPKSRRASEIAIAKMQRERMEEWFHAIGQHATPAAKKLGLHVSLLYMWRRAGRISPHGALLIEREWPKFKAKYLRPDVVDWEEIKKRKPGIY